MGITYTLQRLDHNSSTSCTSLLNLQGFATRFVLSSAIENGGNFSDNQIDQLRRLGGWSQKSAIVHLYVKRIVEEYSDVASLLTPGMSMLVFHCVLRRFLK